MDFKRILYIVLYGLLITLTFIVTCRVFDSRFAEISIDWLAFFAGIILISEGLYKIISDKRRKGKDTILRSIRVVIGTSVFTIHLLQFMRY